METTTLGRDTFQKHFNAQSYNIDRSTSITNPCPPPRFFQESHRSHTSVSRDCQESNMDSKNILKTLFGTEDAVWTYSDSALEKALELKIHQEKTKQEYYKVEAINKSIELMKLVAVAKVPTNLIPCVFGQPQQASMSPIAGPVLSAPMATNHMSTPESSVQHTPLRSPISPSPRRTPHIRGRTMSNMAELKETPFLRTEVTNDNPSPMSTFKFGAGTSITPQRRTSLAPKHQLSPSRIGAHAISSLSRDSGGIRKNINIQRLRHGSNHQRTLSLPTSVSIPEATSVEFQRLDTKNDVILIPDLTGNTPNTGLLTQKKRKVNSIQGFEFYKPNISTERGEFHLKDKGNNHNNTDNDNIIDDRDDTIEDTSL